MPHDNRIQAALQQLGALGWSEYELDDSEGIKDLAVNLFPASSGVLEAPHQIAAKSAENAEANSKSEMRGFRRFPLHTDQANSHLPPRYIILRSISDCNDAATELISKDAVSNFCEREPGLSQGIWLTAQRRRGRLCKVVEPFGIRFDEDCMTPQDAVARRAQSAFVDFLATAPVHCHNWSGTQTALMIDNWRTLHGRSEIEHGVSRRLERIYLCGTTTH